MSMILSETIGVTHVTEIEGRDKISDEQQGEVLELLGLDDEDEEITTIPEIGEKYLGVSSIRVADLGDDWHLVDRMFESRYGDGHDIVITDCPAAAACVHIESCNIPITVAMLLYGLIPDHLIVCPNDLVSIEADEIQYVRDRVMSVLSVDDDDDMRSSSYVMARLLVDMTYTVAEHRGDLENNLGRMKSEDLVPHDDDRKVYLVVNTIDGAREVTITEDPWAMARNAVENLYRSYGDSMLDDELSVWGL